MRPLETTVFFLCAVYLFTVGWLIVAAVGITILGDHTPAVITSDSMGPAIRRGDIVLSRPTSVTEVGPGTVVTFPRPGYPDQLLTHRVVQAADGLLWTKGDANSALDSSVITTEEVVGVGRILVPVVALPVVWARGNAWVPLGIWSIVTLIALDFV